MESDYLKLRRARLLGIAPKEEKKKAKPIAKRSVKLSAKDREYKKIVKEMLEEDNRCELKTPNCIHIATGLHHKKRRGINLLNRKYLLRSCDPCNGFVEQHPQYALDNGLSVSVHKVALAEYDPDVKAIIVK